jgi:hypothetical protein
LISNGANLILAHETQLVAIKEAQAAFAGVADKAGWENEDDVLNDVMKLRYGIDA